MNKYVISNKGLWSERVIQCPKPKQSFKRSKTSTFVKGSLTYFESTFLIWDTAKIEVFSSLFWCYVCYKNNKTQKSLLRIMSNMDSQRLDNIKTMIN